MKYVIVLDGGDERPILLDEILSHDSVASHNRVVVSAGFCSITASKALMERVSPEPNIHVQAWGESGTLGKASRTQDAEIILKALKRIHI